MPTLRTFVFSSYEFEKDPQHWRERTEHNLSDKQIFAKLDEDEKIAVLMAHLYFKALDEQEQLTPGKVDQSKKRDIHREIKTPAISQLLSLIVKTMDMDECLKEVDDSYFTTLAYGTSVGDKPKYKQRRALNNYYDSLQNGTSKEFHKQWNAERQKEKEEEEASARRLAAYEEEQKKKEEEKKKQEEARKKAEEERKAQEEAQKRAEEERKAQEAIEKENQKIADINHVGKAEADKKEENAKAKPTAIILLRRIVFYSATSVFKASFRILGIGSILICNDYFISNCS